MNPSFYNNKTLGQRTKLDKEDKVKENWAKKTKSMKTQDTNMQTKEEQFLLV
jgi:hypothetical protein